MLRCNDLVAANLLVKLPCVKAQGVICACMVLSTNLAKMLLFQLVGNQPYGTHAAKQWNLLDLWIINPFSRVGLEP